MTEPAQSPQPATAKREPQTAVAPLNTIAREDVGAGAKAFDTWLRKISWDYVTLERLTTVAGSLPIIGNIMAAIDAVMDIVRVVEKRMKNEAADFLDWVSLGINLIGIIPVPPSMGAARMSLRPALHLVKQRFAAGAKNIGEALVTVLVTHLNDKLAGEIETFVEGAMSRLSSILQECAKLTDGIADNLIDVLNRCLGNKPLFNLTPLPPPETKLHDPKTQSRWDRMLSAMDRAQKTARAHIANTHKRAANYVAAKTADFLPEAARGGVLKVIAGLTDCKATFRTTLMSLADEKAERGIQWMLSRLLDAVRRHKKTRTVAVPGDKGVQVTEEKAGAGLGAVGHQVPAVQRPSCDCAGKKKVPKATPRSISFATGTESFSHTDFVLHAPLPIEWRRTYSSDLSAFDQGVLGARWVTRFTTRVDTVGRREGLVYRGADGRSHRFPWLEVGQTHRNEVEEITVTRPSAALLLLDFGSPVKSGSESPWRETYELVDTVAPKVEAIGTQHFRLVALQTLNGVGVGLRYDHMVSDGPCTGEQLLSDILSKQGDRVIAHVGVQPDLATGRIAALWEVKDGQLARQLAAYEYDDLGDLVQAQDENAAPWQYTYKNHLVTRYTDRTGRGVNLAYDGEGPDAKAIREWADDGSFDTRLEWDENIRLTYVTDALGQETWYYYDILGFTYRIIHPDKREEWFFRDDAKNVTRHVHPDGTTDDYRYDESGHLIQHVRADGSRVHFEYDNAGRLTGLMDPGGGVWRRDYDHKGRLTEQTDPLGNKTEYTYDAAGRLAKVTDAKGGTKKLAYTDDGRLARYTDCSGRTSQWDYDERGRLAKAIDAAGNETTYRYTPVTADALHNALLAEAPGNHPGRLEAVIHADESVERYRHDAEGRLLAHTDALDRTTTYRYSAAGLLEERVDPLGQRLSYRWDKLGRLTELRNENGAPYSFQYDPVGQLLKETRFDGKSTEYRYADDTGVLEAVIDGPVTTKLEFDPLGRLRTRKATPPGMDEQTESFGYYPGGQLAEARNEHARLQWFYDAAGNLVREHHHYHGAFSPEKRTAVWLHRYNELNQRIGTTRPDGHTLEWLTYGSGHVHGLVLDGEDVISFERDALHREVHRLQGNGIEQSLKYDALGRLLEQTVRHASRTAPLDISALYASGRNGLGDGPAAIVRRYKYDNIGQLQQVEDSRRGRLQYQYDPVGRLLQATGELGTERFAFDPAGNIQAGQEPETSLGAVSHRPALPKVLDNLLKEFVGTRYQYDDRGNLIERVHQGERTEFQWDAFGRMVKAVTPHSATTFAYDPLGRRIAKCITRANTSQENVHEDTLFGWEGDTLAFESRTTYGNRAERSHTVHYISEPGGFTPLLQARREGSIELKPTTDVKALMAVNDGQYAQELDPLWNGELDHDIEPFHPTEIAYYQCDHLGTPQELTDHEGRLAWGAQYKAWGQAKEVISDAARKAGFTNPIRFQGQYLDEETGLHYNRHRYYDPHSGRFVSSDPVGLQGGLNLHAYAPNPVQYLDPLGLTSGKAVVRHYDTGSRTGHYTVETHQGARKIHTHQISFEDTNGTTIVDEKAYRLMDNTPVAREVEIPLPDAASAQKYQRQVEETDCGTYDEATNSCLTHVGNVLRAGGVAVPEDPRQQGSFFRRLGFKLSLRRPGQ